MLASWEHPGILRVPTQNITDHGVVMTICGMMKKSGVIQINPFTDKLCMPVKHTRSISVLVFFSLKQKDIGKDRHTDRSLVCHNSQGGARIKDSDRGFHV